MQHPWDKGALRNSRLRLHRKRSRRQNLKTLEGNVGRVHHTLQLDMRSSDRQSPCLNDVAFAHRQRQGCGCFIGSRIDNPGVVALWSAGQCVWTQEALRSNFYLIFF